MSTYKDNINHETDDDGIEFLDEEAYNAQDEFDDEEELDIYEDDAQNEEDLGNNLEDDVDYVKIHKELTKKPTLQSELLSCFKILIIAVVIAFIVTQFVVMNAEVPTGSMKNTIMEGDRLVGLRLAYTFSSPERGDIVIFKNPLNEEENFIKRVIGLPGDVIQIINGSVYVNSTLYEEDYLLEPMNTTGENLVFVVPKDCYFMMGDNRNNSHDSRYWSRNGVPAPYVSKDQILAKALFKYYNKESKSMDFEFLK